MIVNIKNHLEFNEGNNSHFLAVENLLNSFREGKHVILAPREFLSSISRCDKFGVMTRHSSSEAVRSQMEYQTLKSHVNFYVELDFSLYGDTYSWSNVGDKSILSVSPDIFMDSKSVQKIGVICENPTDADFYHIIATYYSKSINKSIRCPIKFEAINGGGGTTKDVFDRRVNNKDMILCILDNDKKHPSAPKGETCKAFKGAQHISTGMIKVIDAHEAESLIPLATIREVVNENGANKQQNKALSFWEELVDHDESVKFYFDHKKGIDLPTALKLDNAHGEYWLPLLKKSSFSKGVQCIEQAQCNCKPPCLKFEGYGDNILSQTIKHINYGNVHTYTPQLTEHMKDLWFDIGRVFFSWCCAPVKKARA